MESFFTRYRNHLVLLAVLVAQIAGLAVQVRRTDSGRGSIDPSDSSGVRVIRYWAQALVAPPERLIHGSKLGLENVWNGYINLHGTSLENKDLKNEIDRLRLEQAELLEDARQGQRLQAMLGFQEHYIYKTIPAQVFGSSGSDQSKVFYIDKGSADGLGRDMPVISADGIVGKVREVFPHSAQVLAVNDQTSGAGVILETTRIRGVLKGNAAGRLEVTGLMSDARIKPGERVLTAGGDMIFPRGLPVGTVQKVVPDPERDSFILVVLTPAAHLNQLDEVLVITSTEPRFSAQSQKDMADSEALKGAEAQAIKDQLKASEIMAEKLPGLKDANAPAGNAQNAQQPGATAGQNGQPATPAAPSEPKLLPTLHQDRLSPGAGTQPAPLVKRPAPATQTPAAHTPAAHPAAKPAAKPPAPHPTQPSDSGRNP